MNLVESNPGYRKDGERDPVQVLASENKIVFDGTLQDDIGVVEPGTVLGERDDNGRYEQVVKAKLDGSQSSGASTLDVQATPNGLSAGEDIILEKGDSDEETLTLTGVDKDSNTLTVSGTTSNSHPDGASVRSDNGTDVADSIYPGADDVHTDEEDDNIVPRLVFGAVHEDTLKNVDSLAKSDLDHVIFE